MSSAFGRRHQYPVDAPPCLTCAAHALGRMSLELNVVGVDGPRGGLLRPGDGRVEANWAIAA